MDMGFFETHPLLFIPFVALISWATSALRDRWRVWRAQRHLDRRYGG